MPTITVYGQDIEVGEGFDKLSPEQQQSMVNQIAKETGLGKTERFLQNVTPQGPISGLISLMRLSGQAIRGQAPQLMTEEGQASAVPSAVEGALFSPGARAFARPIRAFGASPIEATGTRGVRTYEPPPGRPWEYQSPMAPEPPPQISAPPLKPGLTPDEARFLRGAGLATERVKAESMAAKSQEAPYAPAGYEEPTAPSSLLPSQVAKEFGAVYKGVQLREKLNPESATNLSSREAALNKASQPHLREIFKIGSRSPEVASVVDKAFEQSTLSNAIRDPGKAASLAAWMGVYERAAKANFSPQAQASLALATRNLNNNLGTNLTIKDILGGSGGKP